MSPEFVMEVGKEALFTATLIASVPLLAALVVGLVIGMVQAATQIQEMTLSFIPKLLVLAGAIIVGGPWMLQTLTSYTRRMFESIPGVIG